MGLSTVCLCFLTFLKLNGLFFYFSSHSLISIFYIILTILSDSNLLNVTDIGGLFQFLISCECKFELYVKGFRA